MKSFLFLNGISSLALFAMSDVGGAGGGGLVADTGFFSIADLAGMNTDDIKALTSRIPPAGIFRVRGTAVEGKESDPVEGKAQMYRFNYQYEVLAAKPIDKNTDPESLVGRKLSESFPVFGDQIAEGIGLMKGRNQLVGLPNAGMPMGGVAGKEPGWLDLMVGHEFDIRIRHGVVNGGERAFFDWLKPEAAAEQPSA